MKNFILAFIMAGIGLPTCVFAVGDTLIYYNTCGQRCTKEEACWYRKVSECTDTTCRYILKDYYMNDTIRALAQCLDTSFKQYTGPYKFYYENGKLCCEGTYMSKAARKLNSEKTGTWFYYYQNGNKHEEFRFEPLEHGTDEFLMNSWDSTGTPWVVNGDGRHQFTEKSSLCKTDLAYNRIFFCDYKEGKKNGVQKGFYENGKVYCEETYESGSLKYGISYDSSGKKYSYKQVVRRGFLRGGDKRIYGIINRFAVYPEFERTHNIKGRVMIRFTIDTDGEVTDIEVVKGVNEGLDNEAIRVVKMLPHFKPYLVRGQPEKSYFNLPIVFR